jgi:hypothetical protein
MMLFRPNYCCDCGEKIEREQWRFWTSTRFCELCETANKPYELLSRGAVALGTLILIFWVGSAVIPISRTEAETATIKPRNVQNKKDDDRKISSERTIRTFKADIGAESLDQAGGSTDSVKEDFPPIFSAKRAKNPESVYFCGARTKKGTACTRRVKEAGKRCWQHEGMPAMKDEKPPSELDF